jgi:histone deacetylase 6
MVSISLAEMVLGLTVVTDYIRGCQAKQLYDNYKLTSLYIYRTRISKSFENQVLAR